MGYEGNAQAETPGQFSVRGGIIDIFPLTLDNPVRIELWGDEIDSIRSFDPESQRSIENLEEVTIYPAAEMVLDQEVLEKGLKAIEKEKKAMVKKLRDDFLTEEGARLNNMVEEAVNSLKEYQDFSAAEHFIRYFYKDAVTFLDYFSTEDTLVFLDETNRLAEQGRPLRRNSGKVWSIGWRRDIFWPGRRTSLCPAARPSRISIRKTACLCVP